MLRLQTLGLTALLSLALGSANAAPVPSDAPWVTVRGRILWPEKVPVPENPPIQLPLGMDRDYALKGGPLFEDKVLVGSNNRGLKNVIVSLRPDVPDKKAAFPLERIHPDYKAAKPIKHVVKSEFCRYDRRILAVREGDTIEFRNDQVIADNIRFDIGDLQSNRLLKSEESWTTESLKVGHMGNFQSSIHPWMRGYVRVFDHPYFAITDADGFFEIPKAPAGKWRIHYWHELGFHKGPEGRNGFPIEVKDEGRGAKVLAALEYEKPKPP